MAGEIKLPLIGSVKKSWAIAGGILTAGIVGYAYIRHAKNASLGTASTGTADTTGTTADTGITATDANLDPETGFDYGTAADQEALAQLETGSGSFGGGGGFGGFDEILPPGNTGTTTSTSNTGPGTFTDNAHWIAWCEDNVQGYSPQQIQGALSAAEARIKVTPAQLTIFQACLAVGGPPPAGIPTPAVKSTGSHGGTGTHQTVKVPKVTGESYNRAAAELKGHHLVAHRAEPDVGTVTSQDPAAGTEVHEGATVVLSGRHKK